MTVILFPLQDSTQEILFVRHQSVFLHMTKIYVTSDHDRSILVPTIRTQICRAQMLSNNLGVKMTWVKNDISKPE